MPDNAQTMPEIDRPPLGPGSLLVRLAAIGIVIAAVVGTFAWLGGWFSPQELTPARFVDGFEQVGGIHPGFRRNHAKGVCVGGVFESNGNAARLSKAGVFKAGSIPVVGRFSFGGGDPMVADAPDMVRGLGLLFTLADGEEWRTAMINLPVFIVNTPEGFYERMIASKPDPATGKPDPAKMQAFAAAHPETGKALEIVKSQPPASGFANSRFNGLNAFRFIDLAGKVTPVRWSLAPEDAIDPADAKRPADADKNYLFDALIARIHREPLKWHLIITVGQAGDPTSDATLPWPAEREQIDAGVLTLDRVASEDNDECRDINFDPLVLPDGIEPSDDPLLSARSAVYSQGFTRREGEPKSPSAISPAEVRKEE